MIRHDATRHNMARQVRGQLAAPSMQDDTPRPTNLLLNIYCSTTSPEDDLGGLGLPNLVRVSNLGKLGHSPFPNLLRRPASQEKQTRGREVPEKTNQTVREGTGGRGVGGWGCKQTSRTIGYRVIPLLPVVQQCGTCNNTMSSSLFYICQVYGSSGIFDVITAATRMLQQWRYIQDPCWCSATSNTVTAGVFVVQQPIEDP